MLYYNCNRGNPSRRYEMKNTLKINYTDVFFDNQELFEENDTIEYVIKTLADKVESGEIE